MNIPTGTVSVLVRPSNLPLQRVPPIGREKELAAMCELLLRDDARLVTMTGPGGTGKTRLALEVAASLLDRFDDGIFFVALASITDPALVPPAIAQAMDMRETGGRSLLDTLKQYLREKQLLLLLDNFEQVIEAAHVIAELMSAAPRLKVLITSREALNLYAERDFQVPPLDLPPLDTRNPALPPPLQDLTQYEAVSLFVERAVAVKPDFVLTQENALAVAEICRRLDGLPLAIELAAARIRLLTPQAMLVRLENKLKLLTGGARDLPARHQNLRSAIEWSYSLLDQEEQKLFRRLSIFVGGYTLETVEAVCNAEGEMDIDTLDGVDSLVRKSLLRELDEVGGEARFGMLETVHEYGREKLEESGETEVMRRRHADFFTEFVEQVEPQLRGPDQVKWLDRLEAEHDNLRAALRWTNENGDREVEARLAVALALFWSVRGHFSEGRRFLEAVLERSRHLSAPLKAKALLWAGKLAFSQGEYEQAHELYERSLALYRELEDRQGVADVLLAFAFVAVRRDEYEAVRTFCEQALALYRELKDKHGMGETLALMGNLEALGGNYTLERALYVESLALRREVGDKRGMALPLLCLGELAVEQGEYARAHSLLQESLTIRLELRDMTGIGHTLAALADVALAKGDYAVARSYLEEGLSIRRKLEDQQGAHHFIVHIGYLSARQGNYSEARMLLEESLATARKIEDTWAIIHRILIGLGEVERGERNQGAARRRFEESLALAREFAHKQTTAQSLYNLGLVDLDEGNYEAAYSRFVESLGLSRELGDKSEIALCLRELAWIAGIQREPERAIRLLGASEALHTALGVSLSPPQRAEYERNLAAIRAQLDEATFAAAWARGSAMPAEQAVELAVQAATGQELPTPKAPPGWVQNTGGLTRRELEVLRLMAQGLTDPQVADQLSLSARTVETHLRSIYNKLGVSTRTEAARFAFENKLA